MKTKYITITVRKKEERCYTSVARGLVLVAIGIICYVGILAALWSMTIQALGAEPKTDIIPPDYETVQAIISTVEEPTAADLYVEESDNLVTASQSLANPSPLTDGEWAALLEVCDENRIAPTLALGLIQTESSFQPAVVSASGCYGYCQLNPRYFPTDLSPEDNIRYGINYLGACIRRYDNLEAGLTAYNAGYDTGARGYAERVLVAAEEWEGLA